MIPRSRLKHIQKHFSKYCLYFNKILKLNFPIKFLQFSSYTYSQFIYVIILHYSTQGPNLHFYMEPLIYHAFFIELG